ncbi:MAG: hypothetical protein AB7O62_00285 [Pirellulales bacterium]
MPDWVQSTIVGVASTLIASVIAGATVWAAKSYKRFVGIESQLVGVEGHLAAIAEGVRGTNVLARRNRRAIREQGDRLEEVEGRVIDLEHKHQEGA